MGQSRREFRTEAYVALAYFRGACRVDAVAREPRRRGGLRRGDAPSGTIRPDGCVLSPPCPAWCAFVPRKTSVDARFSPVRRSACRLLPRARRRRKLLPGLPRRRRRSHSHKWAAQRMALRPCPTHRRINSFWASTTKWTSPQY